MSFEVIKAVLRRVVSAFYPGRCPFCDQIVKEHDVPCAACEASVVELASVVLSDAIGVPSVERVFSCYAYDGPVKDSLHRFKFSGRMDHAGFYASKIATQMGGGIGFDAIVPVPMHAKRLSERGFNQSALISNVLARMTGSRQYPDALICTRDVRSQVGLDRSERRENVAGAFSFNPKRLRQIGGFDVLLVDDILTTGATLEACAKTLLKAGARSVSAATVARTI